MGITQRPQVVDAEDVISVGVLYARGSLQGGQLLPALPDIPLGILFVAASLLSLHRLGLVRSAMRDSLFLLSLVERRRRRQR